jgi:hypothetical protein
MLGAGTCWALWNLRGNLSILDSDRSDLPDENGRGPKLDRAILDVLP